MLLQLRDFIAREKFVSTQQLTRAFQIDLSALQPMLDCWVSQGVIARQEKQGCARSCGGCRTDDIVYYQYLFKS
jgi:hypothetical protein